VKVVGCIEKSIDGWGVASKLLAILGSWDWLGLAFFLSFFLSFFF
jgi:hypothetical protein